MKDKLLIIDDDQVFCAMLKRHFEDKYNVASFSSPEEAVSYLREKRVDVVLTDFNMPGMDGMQVLEVVKSGSPTTDVIIMTAYAQVDTAVEAMKKGAHDYIIKPFSTDELSLHLKNLFEKRRLFEENADLKKFIDIKYKPENLIGISQPMENVRRFIEKVSSKDFPVLITGESGSGKELAARAIHFFGKRKGNNFLSIHCAALPDALFESDLFGYEKGAFPGAEYEKGGLFEKADGGTLLLDEISDMPISIQAKLVAVLERRAIRRLGGAQEIPIDVMIVAVTNKDLNKMQMEGNFRSDLFYRLEMFSLRLPPLRERKEDIPRLAEHFFSQYKTEFGREAMELSPEAVDILMKYNWPGNVRELKGLFAKICLLEEADIIRPEHILARLELPGELEQIASLLDPELDMSLGDIEKNLIEATMKKAKGNMTQAAKLLNISYDTLRYRLKKFEIT